MTGHLARKRSGGRRDTAGAGSPRRMEPVPPDPGSGCARLALMSGEHAVMRTTLVHGLVEAARQRGRRQQGIRPSRSRGLPDRRAAARGAGDRRDRGLHKVRLAVRSRRSTRFHPPLEAHRATLPAPPSRQGGRDGSRLARRAHRRCSKAPGEHSSWRRLPDGTAPERILYEDDHVPAVRQDVAVVVDEDVEAGTIVAAAREAGRGHARPGSSTSTTETR